MKHRDPSTQHLVKELQNDLSDIGVEGAIASFSSTPATARRPNWTMRYAAIAVCVALVGTGLMLPRKSSAASSLVQVVAAQKRPDIMYHVQPYWVEDGVRTPKIWSGYVMGAQWRYVQADFEQGYDGVNLTTYSHFGSSAPSATIEKGDQNGMSQFMASADLGFWTSRFRNSVELERRVQWQGKTVDKYVHKFSFRDESGKDREGVTTLYADSASKLPLYLEDIYSPSNGNALEWTYVDPPQPGLLKVGLPKGLPVRDVTGERKPQPLGEPSKAAVSGQGR